MLMFAALHKNNLTNPKPNLIYGFAALQHIHMAPRNLQETPMTKAKTKNTAANESFEKASKGFDEMATIGRLNFEAAIIHPHQRHHVTRGVGHGDRDRGKTPQLLRLRQGGVDDLRGLGMR